MLMSILIGTSECDKVSTSVSALLILDVEDVEPHLPTSP